MLSRLYNDSPDFHTPEILDAAKLGADFLRTHGPAPGNRVYFALTREGEPLKLQRKIFAECFMVMALSEYARAIKESDAATSKTIFGEACTLFEHVTAFQKVPSHQRIRLARPTPWWTLGPSLLQRASGHCQTRRFTQSTRALLRTTGPHPGRPDPDVGRAVNPPAQHAHDHAERHL